MPLIRDTDSLARVCAELSQRPFVAMDTEFMRETTFWPKLCLVQAAADGVEALIDPLADGLDLAPLLDLMADRNVLKVFHAARQDLEIFVRLAGRLPQPVFDTQIAAMAAGFGESVAYDALVQGLLRRKVDKSHRFTDWSRRPLSEEQLTYALADVTHLRDLYPKLRDKLERSGRLDWVEDELAALLDLDAYDTKPENAWRRLKPKKWSRDYLVALEAAAAWRDRVAQARDVPRGRVLKDDALYEIADQRPRDADAFDRLRATPKGFGRSRHGAELLAAMTAALNDIDNGGPAIERGQPSPQGVGPTVELLRVLLRQVAENEGVAARLIASSADLEAIAGADGADVPALTGWRRAVFGEKALALKHGRIGLTLRAGKVCVTEI